MVGFIALVSNDPTGSISNFELVLEGGPGKGVSYDNIDVDSNGNVLIQEDETAFGGDVDRRKSGCWHLVYNIASDKVNFVFDENAASAQFNDPEEPGKHLASLKSN